MSFPEKPNDSSMTASPPSISAKEIYKRLAETHG